MVVFAVPQIKGVMMKFYYTKSACSLAVRIVLNELEKKYENVEVDLKAKKTTTGEDFLAINPKGAVPTIALDNGEVITENQVIMQYLCDTTKGQQLLAPVGDMARYHTLEWLNYVSTEMHKTLGALFNPNLEESTKEKMYLPMIKAKLQYLNNHLAKNTYLTGEHFTLPDAYLFVILRWTYYFKIDISSYTHVEKFMQHMATRPSVIESLKQEGLK